MTVIIDGTTGITSPAESVSGNLTFTGTGNRITGDFSNATTAAVSFQTSTTNGVTAVTAIPNGTSQGASFRAFNGVDQANASWGYLGLPGGGGDVRVISGQSGTGTYLPMTFFTGGSERVRVNTSGNVGIGTSSPLYKLHSLVNNEATAGVTYPVVAENVSSAAGNTNGAGIGLIQGTRQVASLEGVRTNPAGDYGSALIFKTNNTSETNIGFSYLTERARIDSSGQMHTTNGAGVVAKAYDCRAWVNFNGTGTVAIRASGNVSSITDNGTGDYTVNFATAMPDANYSVVASASDSAGASAAIAHLKWNATAPSTTAAKVRTTNDAGTAVDLPYVCVAVFR